MKKCPTCGKTFEDNLKFCQTDGTALIDDAPPPDPYQTVVIRPEDIGVPVPLEPITPSTKAENVDDVLEIPEDNVAVKVSQDDPLKTMVSSDMPFDLDDNDDDLMKTAVVSEAERKEIFGEKSETSAPPPSPFDAGSAKNSAQSPPPKSIEPNFNQPNFGSKESSSSPFSPEEEKTPPPISPPKTPPPPTFEPPRSPSVPPNTPIPSPFDESMPPGYQTPENPPFKEPEPASTPFGNSPFNNPAPEQQKMQQQQSDFLPSASPAMEQNLPSSSSAPPIADGQNKTLAIVSIVSGLLSLLCCSNLFVPGIIAVVTGFMAKGKAATNPNEYGGSGLALGGIITGGLSILLGFIFIILYALGFFDELFKGLVRGM